MSSSRYRRLASLVSASLLALMLLGTGAAQASAPGWVMSPITKLPPTVAAGKNAGFSFSVTNGGSSNISSLYLVATDVIDPAVYAHWTIVTTLTDAFVRDGSCPTDAALRCSLGALNAGQTAKFLIAFTVGSSAFTVTFQANTTGSIQSPNGHNHGDVLQGSATTAVSSSKDFAGGFQLNGSTFFDDQSVGKRNIQGSTVHYGGALTPVTIQDGFTSFPGTGTDPCDSLNCIGDWTQVQVGNGGVGPVEVKLLIYGQSVKGNFSLSSIGLWHDGSDPNPITTRCTDPSSINAGGQECITVTMQGSNILIDAWLLHNGNTRGLLG